MDPRRLSNLPPGFIAALALAFALPAFGQSAHVTPPEAQAALDQAQQLKTAGDKAGAMAAYRQALEADPKNALARNALGTLLFQAGELGPAIEEFRRATEADPGYALAYYNLGFAARRAKRFADAVPAYQRYIKLAPADPDGLYGLAESYRALGQNAEAANEYEAYARLETRPSERRYVEKAQAFAAELRAPAQVAVVPPPSPPAPAAVTAVAVPAPPPAATAGGPAEAYLAQGDALLAKHETRDALHAFQDAVRADPLSPRAHFKVGVAYADLGYLPQAIAEWKRVLDLDPGNVAAQNDLRKAQAVASPASPQVVQAPPQAAPPALTLAQAAEMAAQNYNQAVSLIQQRRYAEAVTALTAAIQEKPDLAAAYVARGSALIGLGHYENAVQDYLHGLGLNSNQAAPLFGLGEAYRGLGDRTRAAKYYQQCADSTAPDAPSLRDLARRRFADLMEREVDPVVE